MTDTQWMALCGALLTVILAAMWRFFDGLGKRHDGLQEQIDRREKVSNRHARRIDRLETEAGLAPLPTDE